MCNYFYPICAWYNTVQFISLDSAVNSTKLLVVNATGYQLDPENLGCGY